MIMRHMSSGKLRLIERLYDFTTDMNTNVANATTYLRLEVVA